MEKRINGLVIVDGIVVKNLFKNRVNVSIPKGVTVIGKSVFEDCYYLTNVTIPNTVISIDDYAFCHCTHLTHIIIPDSVRSIGNCVFANSALRSLIC